jgi:hypothetical protein
MLPWPTIRPARLKARDSIRRREREKKEERNKEIARCQLAPLKYEKSRWQFGGSAGRAEIKIPQ